MPRPLQRLGNLSFFGRVALAAGLFAATGIGAGAGVLSVRQPPAAAQSPVTEAAPPDDRRDTRQAKKRDAEEAVAPVTTSTTVDARDRDPDREPKRREREREAARMPAERRAEDGDKNAAAKTSSAGGTVTLDGEPAAGERPGAGDGTTPTDTDATDEGDERTDDGETVDEGEPTDDGATVDDGEPTDDGETVDAEPVEDGAAGKPKGKAPGARAQHP